jgi:hypothetical protein
VAASTAPPSSTATSARISFDAWRIGVIPSRGAHPGAAAPQDEGRDPGDEAGTADHERGDREPVAVVVLLADCRRGGLLGAGAETLFLLGGGQLDLGRRLLGVRRADPAHHLAVAVGLQRR